MIVSSESGVGVGEGVGLGGALAQGERAGSGSGEDDGRDGERPSEDRGPRSGASVLGHTGTIDARRRAPVRAVLGSN